MVQETRLESADEVLDEQRAGDGAGLISGSLLRSRL